MVQTNVKQSMNYEKTRNKTLEKRINFSAEKTRTGKKFETNIQGLKLKKRNETKNTIISL